MLINNAHNPRNNPSYLLIDLLTKSPDPPRTSQLPTPATHDSDAPGTPNPNCLIYTEPAFHMFGWIASPSSAVAKSYHTTSSYRVKFFPAEYKHEFSLFYLNYRQHLATATMQLWHHGWQTILLEILTIQHVKKVHESGAEVAMPFSAQIRYDEQ